MITDMKIQENLKIKEVKRRKYFLIKDILKINAYIERINRTTQEQFFNHIEDIKDINEIKKQLL